MEVTVLKKDAIIKGLEISANFYEALQGVVWKLAEGGDENRKYVEVVLLLLQDLDRLAKEQDLLDVVSIEE